MEYKNIYFIGLANGLKPKIILETLFNMPFWKEKNLTYITDSYNGVAVEFCRSIGINIIVIDKNNMIEEVKKISSENNDILLSIGWSKKIPSEFLFKFKKCINCHGGLLPDYRGNRSYMHSYANIEKEYGTTIHFMNENFDDGRIILQGKLKMYLEETPEIIHRRISEITAMLIPEAIRLVENGFEGYNQKGIARYFFKISKEEMEKIRNENEKNIKQKIAKNISPHKKWII